MEKVPNPANLTNSLESKSEKRRIYLEPVRKIIANDQNLIWGQGQLDLISDNGDTLRHAQRVTNCGYLLMKHFAKSENIFEEDIELFVEACLLHDIGKIEVDYKTLRKKYGIFDLADLEIVKAHVMKGCEILRQIDRDERVIMAVFLHHAFQNNPYPPEAVAFRNKKDKTDEEKKFERNGKLLAMIDSFETCAFGRRHAEMKPMPLDKTREALMAKFKDPGDDQIIEFLISQYGELEKLGI